MNDTQRLFGIVGALIGTGGSQCIERVRDGNNSRQQWNFFVFHAMGVTATIERFMV